MSYTAPSAVFALPQYVYDSQTTSITSITSTTRSLTFQVDVPNCYTQVDFVFGATVYNRPVGARCAAYGSAPRHRRPTLWACGCDHHSRCGGGLWVRSSGWPR